MALTIKKASSTLKQSKIFLIAYFSILSIFSLIFSIYGALFYIVQLFFDLGLIYTFIQQNEEIKVYGFWANIVQFILSIIALIAIGLFSWWQVIFLVIDILALFVNWKHCEAAKFLTPVEDSGHSGPSYSKTDEEHHLGNLTLNHPLSNASLVDQFRLNKADEGSNEKKMMEETDSGTQFTESSFPSMENTKNHVKQ